MSYGTKADDPFTKSAIKYLKDSERRLDNTKDTLNQLEFDTNTEVPVGEIRYGSLGEDLPPMSELPSSYHELSQVNILQLASAVITEYVYRVERMSIQQRLRIGQMLEREYKTTLIGVEKKLELVSKQVDSMLDSAELQIKAGKKIMRLAILQYNLRLAQAAAQAVGAGLSVGMPGNPFPADTVLQAMADLLGHSISVIQMVTNGQSEMYQATATIYGAHADSTDRLFSAQVQRLQGDRQLVEDLMSRLGKFADRAHQAAEAITSSSYQGVIIQA